MSRSESYLTRLPTEEREKLLSLIGISPQKNPIKSPEKPLIKTPQKISEDIQKVENDQENKEILENSHEKIDYKSLYEESQYFLYLFFYIYPKVHKISNYKLRMRNSKIK